MSGAESKKHALHFHNVLAAKLIHTKSEVTRPQIRLRDF